MSLLNLDALDIAGQVRQKRIRAVEVARIFLSKYPAT
jgi:hypothetical protein